jgi:chemosensory pili system protein ChpB (putative protein-glutamate methylesterase)
MLPRLRIGLLVDTPLKQQYLAAMITQGGYSLCYKGLVSDAHTDLPDINQDVDAWVVDAADEAGVEALVNPASDTMDALDYLLEQVTVPVILSDSSDQAPGSAAHQEWLRRMAQRLRRLSGDVNLQQANRAASLWILAASTGGPAAVKEFLQHLPAEQNLALIYVQHIDANYSSTLLRMMGSAGRYSAQLATDGRVLQQDSLTLVTADRRVDILENGTLAVGGEQWSGRYAPSIDQVVANVARTYRDAGGLILFTGMGDDGAASCRLLKQQGGQVWAQTPASCTSSSMPEAALATGCVNFTGTPTELAHHLTQHLNQYNHARVALP